MRGSLRLSAVGDIAFEGSASDAPRLDVFADVASLFGRSDLVLGNLECALTDEGQPIAGKCTLRGSPGWARVLRRAGIDVVSLANNHTMDYGVDGLASTIEALTDVGIRHVGAGPNKASAAAPLFLEVAGRRLAVLARTSVVVSAATYASDREPGVAYFDRGETVGAIRECRQTADDVILLLHWGLEEYSYPSPAQRETARALIDAGANVILGHHPHVLQGFERYGGGLVYYSLGNFLFNEFDWSYRTAEGTLLPQRATLTPDNRRSIVATVEWKADSTLTTSTTSTVMHADGRIAFDASLARRNEMLALSSRLSARVYPAWWRAYALHREWQLRVSAELSLHRLFRRVHRLRPHHVRDVMAVLRRSGRMVSQSSTNPYE